MEDLSLLTRAPGIRVAPSFPCSEEEAGLAVGDVVGDDCVRSAARMNGAVVLFLDMVNALVVSGVVIRGMHVPVATPVVRVTVANVPPFIKEEVILKELVKHGKVVSRLRKIPSGCKSQRMRHVWSHRRHLSMILNNREKSSASGCSSGWPGTRTPCASPQGAGGASSVGERGTEPGTATGGELLSRTPAGRLLGARTRSGARVQLGGGGLHPSSTLQCGGVKGLPAKDEADVARPGGRLLLPGQVLPLCHLPHDEGRERSLHSAGVLQAEEDPE